MRRLQHVHVVSCSCLTCFTCLSDHAIPAYCSACSSVDPQASTLVGQQLRVVLALSLKFCPALPPHWGLWVLIVPNPSTLFLSSTCKACEGACFLHPSTECHCSFACPACSFRTCPTVSPSWRKKESCGLALHSVLSGLTAVGFLSRPGLCL